jgi:hypothetical protein
MKSFLPLAALLILFLTGCDEDKYDDDQYGDHCLIVQVSSSQGNGTFAEYDQYDRIISFSTNNQEQNIRMEVTYNNGMAFADLYISNELRATAEAMLNANGDLVDAVGFDPQGTEMGSLQFTYNADHTISSITGQNLVEGVEATTSITWTNGNPVSFTSPNGPVVCDYYEGERSSLNYGHGNVLLLLQPVVGNVATVYANDLLKTFDKNSVMTPQAVHFSYDKDSDDKVREAYFSTTSSGDFGSSQFTYECHTPH